MLEKLLGICLPVCLSVTCISVSCAYVFPCVWLSILCHYSPVLFAILWLWSLTATCFQMIRQVFGIKRNQRVVHDEFVVWMRGWRGRVSSWGRRVQWRGCTSDWEQLRHPQLPDVDWRCFRFQGDKKAIRRRGRRYSALRNKVIIGINKYILGKCY